MPDPKLALGDSGTELTVQAGDQPIAIYVYLPDARPSEAPKPFLAPLRTLSGANVSAYRPWDHRWHKGLQMTWSHVSGDNFWGGPTFVPEEGYVWRDNLGQIRHVGFDALTQTGAEAEIRERLIWISSKGQDWVHEERCHRFHSVDAADGSWQLDFTTRLTNARHEPLNLGSPTTHGRDNAGYTGWFWRGPRAFTGGRVISADGSSSDVMGRQAEWVALSSEHDERDGGATLLFYAGSSSADVPIEWFVRAEPFACVNPSPAFRREIILEPGGSLDLSHRVVVIDRVCGDAEITAFAERNRP